VLNFHENVTLDAKVGRRDSGKDVDKCNRC